MFSCLCSYHAVHQGLGNHYIIISISRAIKHPPSVLIIIHLTNILQSMDLRPGKAAEFGSNLWGLHNCSLKGHSTDFTQFTRRRECRSAWEKSCIMSSVTLKASFPKFEEITDSLYYKLEVWGFKGHFGGIEGLIKEAVKLHYGKCRAQCFWSLAHTRNQKSG